MPDWTNAARKPLLVISGPTCSGKSALAIRLASALAAEIVNADSVQLYRGLVIGAAKTPPEHRRGVPHHLLDVLEPGEIASAGSWTAMAAAAIGDIWSRGKLPIIAGGTGFYIRCLLEGIPAAPARDEQLRERLRRAESRRPGFLVRALRLFDPGRASQIHPHDVNKLLRALEICILARKPASSLVAAPQTILDGHQHVCLVLNPPREALHRRIAERAKAMFSAGLVSEVQGLLAQGIPASAKVFESIGYKESLAVIQGRLNEQQAIDAVSLATRQYAKRQTTWFRKEKNCFWINSFGDSDEAFQQALDQANQLLLR